MNDGVLPPQTSDPTLNEHFDMIDAQLTTEIFGLLSPINYKNALKMSNLPIRTTARGDAALISEFYVIIHSLASTIDFNEPLDEELIRISDFASSILDENSYSFPMYEFVKSKFNQELLGNKHGIQFTKDIKLTKKMDTILHQETCIVTDVLLQESILLLVL